MDPCPGELTAHPTPIAGGKGRIPPFQAPLSGVGLRPLDLADFLDPPVWTLNDTEGTDKARPSRVL